MEPTVSLAHLSLTEKAALGSGATFWSTRSAAGLPAAVLTDGPHGVRAQLGAQDHLGIAASAPATCFPPGAGLAQSWDPELTGRVAVALALEARSHGVGVLLGPAVNIRRDPRGGRNFEYYSEDPILTAALGTAWVRGLQSQGVAASVKHFAANNAEHDRMRSDSQVDPRALREIYLRGFQRIVQDAQPWTVMCSYNKINGVLVSQNRWLLTELLRGEWGFEGAVVSDWGAVRDRVAAVAAGLDLQMPGGSDEPDQSVVSAVEDGRLARSLVDDAARNVLTLLARVAGASHSGPVDLDAHHALAREAAGRSIVLLKNDDALLPLAPDGPLAVIGRFAEHPRYQGGGSSHVNATQVDVPLVEIRALAADGAVSYAQGFGGSDADEDARLRTEAVEAARLVPTAVVFLGLADREESEGFDREHIELPVRQLDLLRAVVAVQPRTVVVLSHGGVVDLAEVDRLAPAVLDGAVLGQAGGGAIADVLFGVVNPSGRLSETVPVRIQDVPSYLNFPGENSAVLYGESIYVGYRWYDARDLDVTYPFGHGLSYTAFDYANLRLSDGRSGVTARIQVTNVGTRTGREVVQFYVGKPGSAVRRAPRELKAFAVVDLKPGQSADVEVLLRRDDLAHWDQRIGWTVENGSYEVSAAASSRDLRVSETVIVSGDDARAPLTMDSTLGEAMAHPAAGPLLAALRGGGQRQAAPAGDELGMDMARMMASIPLERLAGFGAGNLDRTALQRLLDEVNQ